MNDYMVVMQAARKADGEHEQEKHNNSCGSEVSVVSDVPSCNEGNTEPEPKAPSQEPWAKLIEMQQQFYYLMAAVKGAQNAPQKPT